MPRWSLTYHARAAAFMCAAVLAFAFGDALTKLATTTADTVAVLSVRAGVGLAVVIVAAYISGIRINNQIFSDPLLAFRSIWFVVTIALFAFGLKYNSFTGFYVVFFATLPLFSYAIDWFNLKQAPRKSTFLPICVMLLGVIIMYSKSISEVLNFSAILSIATAAAYASYLSVCAYINSNREYNALVQVVPNFMYGGLILLFFALISPESRGSFGLVFSNVQSIIYIVFAGFFSAVGLLFINRATSYDTASRIAPYDYTAVIYAFLIDNWLFGVPVTKELVFGAVFVFGGAIWLSLMNQRADRAQ